MPRRLTSPPPPLVVQPPSGNFEDEALRVLERLRGSLARLIGAVPEAAARAADLRRVFGLDAALAWQIHTLATGGDALGTARIVPKAGAMERFLTAAAASPVTRELAAAARDAYTQFQALVERHAGDRDTFDAMISALRPDGAALQKLRRAAYRANAAVWGVTVRCRLNCVVFHQRPTGEHDCLVVRARLGVQRLRHGATIALQASGITWGGAAPALPIGAGVSVDPCELLEEYCSRPVPRVERIALRDGRSWDQLRLEGLGRASEASVFWRNLSLAFPGGTTAPPHGCTAECLEPTQRTIMDLLIPVGWTDPATARAFATPLGGPYPPGAAVELPFEGGVTHRRGQIDALYTAEEPRYTEIIAAELRRLGWDPAAFDMFRCIVHYPVLHAAVHLCVGGDPAASPGAPSA